MDLAIRYQAQTGGFHEAERVAGEWSAAARNGLVSCPIPAREPVGLIQIVDAHQRVVCSSTMASATVPLSRLRPSSDDRLQRHTECPSHGGCILLQAIRLSPAPDAGVVYAGLREPDLLATYDLEYAIAAGICLIVGIAAWTIWHQVGRTMRPVEEITTRISQITVTDLSPRIPVPLGSGEIAQLATTVNQTFTQLISAVEHPSRFASTVGHELRTPITGLHVQLEEALLYPDDTDAKETIRSARATIDRLEAIIDDLELLACLRSGGRRPLERIDVGELVAAELGVQGGSVPMSVRAVAGLEILGCRMQLIRVLDNLLANARRHAESWVEVAVEPADGGVAVAVTDDGPGVPSAHRERVFERFVRLDESRCLDPGGSGLGLAISRDIAHAHHGTLKLDGSSRGAKFVLWLPLINRCSTDDTTS
jgi:signal transduction histidine kinase